MERYSDRAIEIINELHTERLDYESEYLPLIECANRCEAYEDTGLEPEEIKDILERYRGFRSAISDETGQPMVSWTRAGELVRADKEGRVVALLGDYTEADGEEALRTAMYHCGVTNNPVTRYIADAIAEKLTRDEAKTALKKQIKEN